MKFIRIFGALMILISALVGTPTTVEAQGAEIAIAAQIFALVNGWRLSQGINPLKLNSTLSEMASQQALWVQPFADDLEDEGAFHRDQQGRNAIERAIQVFNWPNYGQRAQVEIGENAGVGSVKFIMNFWENSAIHRRAALNPTYREIGVGVVKGKLGFIVYTVFGARPGVLPAMITPERDGLFLTLERSRFGAMDPAKTEVTLMDINKRPLTAPQPWKSLIGIPVGLKDTILVKISSGGKDIFSEVDLFRDVAALPLGTTVAAPTAVALIAQQPTTAPTVTTTPTSTATPSLTPTRTPLPTNTPRFTQIVPTRTLFPTNTPRRSTVQASVIPMRTFAVTPPPPTVTATFTPLLPSGTPLPPTATSTSIPPSPTVLPPSATPLAPTLKPEEADLLLTYSPNMLLIRNISTRRLNLTGFFIASGDRRITIENWIRVSPSLPVTSFPTANCFGARVGGTNAAFPQGCRNIWSELNPTGTQAIWRAATFTVNLGDKILGTCSGSSGTCQVKLP